MNRNFFATGHGKGAVDGIGGTLKRDVHTAALAKNIVIKKLMIFLMWHQKHQPKSMFKETSQASVTQIDNGTVGVGDTSNTEDTTIKSYLSFCC